MSSSRASMFATLLFRTPRSPPSPTVYLLFPKPHFTSLPPLRFHRFISSSLAAETRTPATVEGSVHPWPEWVAFVDRLKTKGYINDQSAETGPPEKEGGESGDSLYKDMNLLKGPCLSFARDRYDIFKSLSTTEIETLVEQGCPSLLRKVVNSAKRLRDHVQLSEGDVCCNCNLRGSCDRAYVILTENDAAARTVDLVRILLSYAFDPLVLSGGERPPGREPVESSARKLLSELIELSDTPASAALPKPAATVSSRKEQTKKLNDQFDNVEMKRGDWMCPKCNFLNFAKNFRCLHCQEDGPKRVDSDVEMKKGDWICQECSFMNFARNICCLKCKAEGPNRAGVSGVEMKKGDWNCPGCGFMNFASNKKCLRCHEQRPKRKLNPGEWECPSCDFLNYRRNVVCLKCNCERPKESESEYGEDIWKRPV